MLIDPLVASATPEFAKAAREGATAATVGEAFYVGYQAALRTLDPTLDAPASFAVTERGGGHPRAIETTLTPADGTWRLTGEKAFVTGFDRARVLLVVARQGERPDGTPRLCIARVPADARGVASTPLPRLPFTPDITHASVRLTDVSVAPDALLEGDGYADYVKPFRTVEDVHVVGALVAHLIERTRSASGIEREREAAFACLSALAATSRAARGAPAAHLSLAGTLEIVRSLVAGLVAKSQVGAAAPLDPQTVRDLGILRVAESAREARRQRAHATLDPPPARP